MATLLTTDCLLGMFALQDCNPLLALWFLILQFLSPTMGKMSKDRNNKIEAADFWSLDTMIRAKWPEFF